MLQFNDVLNAIYQKNGVTCPVKTIVICDPGVDDALMLLQILNNHQYGVVGIIPVEGNASYKATLVNVLNICEYIGSVNVDIYPCTDYFAQKKIQANVAPVYGGNGLAGLILPSSKKLKPKSLSGFAFACQALDEDKHIIISTGPLTELAKILSQLAEKNIPALKNIIAISMMGGVINASQEANWPVTGFRHTEANFACDKTATKCVFDICRQYTIPIFLSPLDLTHSLLASIDDIKVLKKRRKPSAQLALRLIESVPLHYQIRYERGPNGQYRQPLHDIHSSNCLVQPNQYYGQWVNFVISPHLKKQNSISDDITNANVFLLDMHYLQRRKFFNEFISRLK